MRVTIEHNGKELEVEGKFTLTGRTQDLLEIAKSICNQVSKKCMIWQVEIPDEPETEEKKEEKIRMKSCKDRINEELRDRIKDLRKLWNAYCQGEEEVEDLGNLWDYGLCFDYIAPHTFKNQSQGYFRYQLSWGGPADEFRFYVNPDLTPYKIEYWLLDWFDAASKELKGAEYELLKNIYELFQGMGTVQHLLEETRTGLKDNGTK